MSTIGFDPQRDRHVVEPLPTSNGRKLKALREQRDASIRKGHGFYDEHSVQRLRCAEHVLDSQWVKGLLDRIDARIGPPASGPKQYTVTTRLVFTLLLMNAMCHSPMHIVEVWAQGLRLARCRMDTIGFRRGRRGAYEVVSYDAFLDHFHRICDALHISEHEELRMDPTTGQPYPDTDTDPNPAPRSAAELADCRALMDELVQAMLHATIGGPDHDGDDDPEGTTDITDDKDAPEPDTPFHNLAFPTLAENTVTIDGTGHESLGRALNKHELRQSWDRDRGWRRHDSNKPAVLGYDIQTVVSRVEGTTNPVILNLELAPGNVPEAERGANLLMRTAAIWDFDDIAADRGFTGHPYFRVSLIEAGLKLLLQPEPEHLKPWTDPTTGIIWWAGNAYRPGTPKALFFDDERPMPWDHPNPASFEDALDQWQQAIDRLEPHRMDILQYANSGNPSLRLTTVGGLSAGCGRTATKHRRLRAAARTSVQQTWCTKVANPKVKCPTVTVPLPHRALLAQQRKNPTQTQVAQAHKLLGPQAEPYGSVAHPERYGRWRALGEGVFGLWKAAAGEDISGTKFRIGGITAHTLAVLAWAIAFNLRMQGCTSPDLLDRELIRAYANAGHESCLIPTFHGDDTCDHYLPHYCWDIADPPEVA